MSEATTEGDPLAAYADLMGQAPDETIARVSGEAVGAVARYREALGLPEFAPPAEADPDPEDNEPKRKSKRRQKSVGRVLAQAAPVVVPLLIRLLRTVHYTVRTPQGKPIRMTLPASLDRGEMAHKVQSLVPPDQRDAIEVLS